MLGISCQITNNWTPKHRTIDWEFSCAWRTGKFQYTKQNGLSFYKTCCTRYTEMETLPHHRNKVVSRKTGRQIFRYIAWEFSCGWRTDKYQSMKPLEARLLFHMGLVQLEIQHILCVVHVCCFLIYTLEIYLRSAWLEERELLTYITVRSTV